MKELKDEKNIVIEGPQGVGKTTQVLFPLVEELINNQESMLIVDSKEEYLKAFQKDLIKKNYNVVIVNFRNVLKGEGWNPLSYPYKLYKEGKKDEALNLLDLLASDIFAEESTLDPFWTNCASDIFIASALAIFDDAKENEINITSILNILESFTTKWGESNAGVEYFKSKDKNSLIYKYGTSTFLAPTETRGGILSVANQKLRLFVCREHLCQFIAKSTFTYEEFLDKPTACFLINPDEISLFAKLSTAFIKQLFLFLINNNTNKFNLILDNFDSLYPFDNLTNILSSGISRHIKTYIGTYSYDNLKKYKNIDYLTKLITVKESDKSITTERGNVIEYPTLKSSDIKTFNVLDYMKNNFEEPIASEKIKPVEVKDILKEIDEKIAELEGQEI